MHRVAFLRERDRLLVPPAPASRLVSGDQDDRLAGGVEHEQQAYVDGLLDLVCYDGRVLAQAEEPSLTGSRSRISHRTSSV